MTVLDTPRGTRLYNKVSRWLDKPEAIALAESLVADGWVRFQNADLDAAVKAFRSVAASEGDYDREAIDAAFAAAFGEDTT